MSGATLYAMSMASGVAAYLFGRWAVGLRDIHRDATQAEHDEHMARLLGPYGAVMAQPQRVMPAFVKTSAGTPTSRNAARLMPLRSE